MAILMVVLCDFFGLAFLWDLFAIAIGFLLDSCGMSRICL